jgi:predicted GNAT family acetyltransferase
VTGVEVRPRVIRSDDRSRYEVWVGDERAGFSAYQEPADGSDPLTVFTHTEVDPAFSGHGLGSRLVREALDDVVRRGRMIVPICPFVSGQIRATSAYDQSVRWPPDSADE